MNYIVGFVLAVPTAKREEYTRLARSAAGVFKEHGALSVVECWGDDVPDGKLTSFPMAVKRQDDETVVLFAMFPQQVEALLKSPAVAKAAAPAPATPAGAAAPVAAPAPAAAAAAAPKGPGRHLVLTLNGKRHDVTVETLEG